MSEHRGTAFYNSCVKVPVDPYSRQPTPSYDRPDFGKNADYDKHDFATRDERRINFTRTIDSPESPSPWDTVESFLDFLNSIPEYGQVHHLSNQQFQQKVDYLKRKQRLFLKYLHQESVLSSELKEERLVCKPVSRIAQKAVNNSRAPASSTLELKGRKCYLTQSRGCSPSLYLFRDFSPLAEEGNFTVQRSEDGSEEKESKTMRNNEIHSANKKGTAWHESRIPQSEDSDADSIETKSLPPLSSTKEWHPTVPKPFSFTLREEAEKYMTRVEKEVEECQSSQRREKGKNKCFQSKHRVRPIPLASKIPLYEKLLADKEERSRQIREKSTLNLLSQVRPFKLECERRAWRFLARSNPELPCDGSGKIAYSSSRTFRAKPVPRNLFATEVYDRMLQTEYYRHLKKKNRAAELMKSSRLPPSMARREQLCDAREPRNWAEPDASNDTTFSSIIRDSSGLPSYPSDFSLLASRGTNLAAVLRCQSSREKLERELRDEMEEKEREQAIKIRECLIGRKPVWKALRSAARHEHERDLIMRASLRRDEAREQAERHRLQMEIMLERVTQIPTLFERHSQSYQTLAKMQQDFCSREARRKTRNGTRKLNSGSIESYSSSFGSTPPAERGSSGSLSSLSDTSTTHLHYRSAKSSKSSEAYGSQALDKSVLKCERLVPKRKGGFRGQLKVSINETAQLIEDQNAMNDSSHTSDSSPANHDGDAQCILRNELKSG